MRVAFLIGCAVVAVGGAWVPTASAQLNDRFNRIDGFVLEAEETAYFNIEQCEDPAATTYELRLSTQAGTSVTQVYLWAGRENGECNLNSNRTDITPNCREIAGNPRTLEPDSLISGLTLQELIDTQVVTCDTSGLQGTPYEIFVFRDSDPGSTDVPETDYGIASFRVDVTPPAKLNITNDSVLVGQSFVLSWTRPTDLIELYRFYRSDDGDPANAAVLDGVTADQNATSRTITAQQLGLGDGETTYLHVAAVDQAFQIESGARGGNVGELSDGTQVNAVATSGFCDATGECTGCSVSPMDLTDPKTLPTAALFGLLLGTALGWRRRR